MTAAAGSGQVMTVLGAVDASDLGVVLPHEHLLLDLTVLWQAPAAGRSHLAAARVTRGLFDELLLDPYECRDNLVLDDQDAAAQELAAFRSLGGGTVVDLSSRSIGPYPAELAAIARRTGLNIVASTGMYVRASHPGWVRDASVESLAEHMLRDLSDGYAQAPAVRAGIIGEIGTSSPIHPDEVRVLRAAARAHRASGAAINVHLAIFHREGERALDILEGEGVDPARVALSHVDEQPDAAYHRRLARRGAFLEFDTFGSECHFTSDGLREPTDGERVEALMALLDAGFERQVLLSQDVCTRMQLERFGGRGYAHVLRTVVPALRARGLTEDTVRTLLTDNPRRLLAGAHGGDS